MLAVLATTVVHPAGRGASELWSACAEGRSALTRGAVPWCDLPCWLGAVAAAGDDDLAQTLGPWDCRNHRLAWLALDDPSFRAAVSAQVARHGPDRVGLVVGTSTSGIRSTEVAYAARRDKGRWPDGFDYRRHHSIDAVVRFAAQQLQLEGPMTTVSTACSSSAKVFLTAQRWIELGLIDAAVVGGVDSLCLSTLHGFDALQLLSGDVCRPFDERRTGISIGEAGGFALLGRGPSAVVFAGGGESSDAWHMSTPHPEGAGAQAAMRMALDAAGLQPGDIGYLNAHGTATPANDRSESAAIRAVFGAQGVAVSSTKGITGHTLAAAGIVEAIVSIEALQHQFLPPSANCEKHDPQLDIDLVTRGRPAALRHVMSNSFGFGGSNCSLIFSKA